MATRRGINGIRREAETMRETSAWERVRVVPGGDRGKAPHFEADLASRRYPRVLLLGNGVLRLAGGVSWEALLRRIAVNESISDALLRDIPLAMRVEALCGPDVEGARQRAAEEFDPEDLCVTDTLRRLLALPWDCVLTTNYTYEVEEVLLDKPRFDAADRRQALACAYGSSRRQDNLHLCYILDRPGRPPLPVWHIHGDLGRHKSMILSYYTYAGAVSRLSEFNRRRANDFQDSERAAHPLRLKSWTDWFITGDIYSVGFGYDFSEFDLWWAAERKARENANVGRLVSYQDRQAKYDPVCALLDAVGAEVCRFREYDDYQAFYALVIDDLARRLNAPEG